MAFCSFRKLSRRPQGLEIVQKSNLELGKVANQFSIVSQGKSTVFKQGLGQKKTHRFALSQQGGIPELSPEEKPAYIDRNALISGQRVG